MTREHLVATIDENVLKRWNDYCDKRDINRSRKLERIITEFLKKSK